MSVKTVTIAFTKGGTTYDYICKYPVRVGQYVQIYSEFQGVTFVKVLSTFKGTSEKASREVSRVVSPTEVKNYQYT